MLAIVGNVCAADWRQFRGNDADGVLKGAAGPRSFEHQPWSAELPGRGLSGPIVVRDRVFVTAASGYEQDRLHVLCFDNAGGEPLWERQFWATGRTQCHPKMSVATPTPASDGQRVFAFYSSNDLACLDLDGNLLWYRGIGHDYPNASNSVGMASSPLVVGNTLIVQVESDAEAFALGLDVETGLARWKIDRPRRANWTSPSLIERAGGEGPLVLLQSSAGVSAVEPGSGREVWKYTEGAATIPSGVAKGQQLYVPSHGLTALRHIPGSESPELLWREQRLGPATASPLVVGEQVYVINSAGVLNAGRLSDGELVWRLRIEGSYSASPIAVGDLLYAVNEAGVAKIVRLGESEGEILDEHEFGQTVLATPALAGGALYIRGESHLWKVGGGTKALNVAP
ncbi:MAG: PQQ-like beta-propeller repeat protein [Planctomycetes bacterium]|nr:PQQ-like beta-propeller repeat protein [Planctomycetota bacterium]